MKNVRGKEINVNSLNILSCKCGIYERRRGGWKCCNNLRHRQGASGNFHLLEIVVGENLIRLVLHSATRKKSARLSKRLPRDYSEYFCEILIKWNDVMNQSRPKIYIHAIRSRAQTFL